VLTVGASLLSEHDENTEYDRAIIEMTGDLLGLTVEDRPTLYRIMRAVR